MTVLSTLATILYTIVALSFIGNFIRLFIESKKLKEKKQTPLIGKTVITIILATLAELIVLFLLLKVAAILGLVSSVVGTVVVFIVLYYARTLSAYLTTWGVWTLFVRIAKNKELQKMKEDIKKEKASQ